MSNVAKAGPAAAPPSGTDRPAEPAPKAGAFDKVLQDKGHRERTEAGERTAERRRAGADERTTRGSACGSPRAPAEREKAESRDWRALPGDTAVPSRAPAGSAPVAESSRAAEAVSRVERIAEQIVRAVEVRLGQGGTAEMRLDLDLGGLGQVRVAMHLDTEGAITVRFDAAGPEVSRLLVDRGSDLVARLEARGIVLHEVAMRSADGSLVRIGVPSETATAELVSRLAEDAARSRGQASSRQAHDREGGRRTPERVEEDEDE